MEERRKFTRHFFCLKFHRRNQSSTRRSSYRPHAGGDLGHHDDSDHHHIHLRNIMEGAQDLPRGVRTTRTGLPQIQVDPGITFNILTKTEPGKRFIIFTKTDTKFNILTKTDPVTIFSILTKINIETTSVSHVPP